MNISKAELRLIIRDELSRALHAKQIKDIHTLEKEILLINCDIRARTYNVLRDMGARTLGDVTEFTAEQIIARRRAGIVTLRDIQECLYIHKLRLKD